MTDATDRPDAEPDDDVSATINALEDALDALREHHPDTTPQWEFCEGVLTAMLCTRRAVPQDEWLVLLFGPDSGNAFASPAERTHFSMHWLAREAQLRTALQTPVQALDDERTLAPAAMDWRGLLATLSDEERAEAVGDGPPPALGQLWAAGFMAAIDWWADDWAPPRDKDIAAQMLDAIDCIAELLEDDRDTPTLNLYDEAGPPSVSEARFEAFGEAIWAVYDLFDVARSLGPRVPPAQSSKIGRNDPCPCGSGQKYKKCCGA